MVCDPQDSLYYVTSHYTTSAQSYMFTEVDDILDCDYANAINYIRIKNDNLGEAYRTYKDEIESENTNSSSENVRSKQSGTGTTAAVGDGSLFSASTKIECHTYAKSEAHAHGNLVEYTCGPNFLPIPAPPDDDD